MRTLKVLQEHREGIRDRATVEVTRALDQAELAAAARAAHAAMERETERARARSALQPACSAGCSYCCHVHADATAPEILAVAAHITRTFRPAALQALREELGQHVERVAHLDDDERWARKIPCALLDEAGRCSVHPARPLRCRAFHSGAVEECRDAFEGRSDALPSPLPLLERAAGAVEEGYDRALAAAGMDPEGFRLEIGLRIALDDPLAEARFRAGEPVFAPARPKR